MKGKKLTTSFAIFMMLALFVIQLAPTVTALSEEKGSITLNLTDAETKKPVADTSFRLYYIAKAYVSGNSVRYEMIPPYDKANVDTNALQDSSIAVHLACFASSNAQPHAEKSTDEKGVLVFENLTPGMYLIVPVQKEEASYTVSPFVVSVPGYDSQNKKWNYHIDASPKFSGGDGNEDSSETYLSVVKKWETNSSHPESITVVLLRDFQEYKRVELNSGNNWHYRFDNLPKNHTWNVVEMKVPDGFTVYYEASSNTVTIINKADKPQEDTTGPSEEDTTEDKLVQTGQLNWPIPICAISGLIIFSIGWAVLNFNKEKSE